MRIREGFLDSFVPALLEFSRRLFHVVSSFDRRVFFDDRNGKGSWFSLLGM